MSSHRTLNTVRGVISEQHLLDISDDEIAEGLSDEGVVDAKRITIRRDGKVIPAMHIVITLSSTRLPDRVKTGYLNYTVKPYVPNARKWFNCQVRSRVSKLPRKVNLCKVWPK